MFLLPFRGELKIVIVHKDGASKVL